MQNRLKVRPCGEFWRIERAECEVLAFLFGSLPVVTRTKEAAMWLAEYCQPPFFKGYCRIVTAMAALSTIVATDRATRVRAWWRRGLNQSCAFGSHPGLMPANLITLANFWVSFTIKFANSLGRVEKTTAPKSLKRVFVTSSARHAFTCVLRRSTISPGVPFGTASPVHPLVSYPAMYSPIVGISANALKRVAVVTANGMRLPLRRCAMDESIGSNVTCTSPARRLVSMGAE